ncbi:PrsW family intramembrane metalloprotease [Microbacterium betulae]|uniref:PrsW family intramembrane metalloprotease n=1 Tax=Microbacterium betulae TaxID=2981139 RepID=A0AA97I5Y9_9MICO|nr:PrsW family intramembrane metalloprotease [Microbacterium sp. AB]WOF22052.1 PrsW family intramembrane metalloprotease [Microbacterium sp. AB]
MTSGTGLPPSSQEPFATPLDQPRRADGASIPPGGHVQPHLPRLPVPSRSGRTAWFWLWGVLALLLLGLVSYFTSALGAAASVVGLVLALVPFAVVVSAMLWVDRWEPEPRSLVVFALAWGAIASVGFALLWDLGVTLALPQLAALESLGTVVQAPIVEELAKGVGVLLVLLMGRRAFDGPVDGVVYGALVGAGFAFTENIQYFAVSAIEGGAASLTWTFVLRGLMSPFAHAMFTAVTGFALGLAARRGASFGASLRTWLAGLIGAIVLHGLWNASATFTDLGGFLHLYVVLQVPLFAIFLLILMRLRREEERLTKQRLGEYAAAGWFTSPEVEMLATPSGRRAGMAWARSLRGDRSALMKSFIRDATALAATRQRAISGRDPKAADDERVLLVRAAHTRQALLSS